MVDPRTILKRITTPHNTSQTIAVIFMCLLLVTSVVGIVTAVGETQIWNSNTGEPGTIMSAAIDDGGDRFFTAQVGSPLIKWDVSDGAQLWSDTFSDHDRRNGLAYNDQESYVAVINTPLNDDGILQGHQDSGGQTWSVQNNAFAVAERNGTSEFYSLNNSHIIRRQASTGSLIDAEQLDNAGVGDHDDIEHAEAQSRVYVTTGAGVEAYTESLTFLYNTSTQANSRYLAAEGSNTYVTDGSDLVKLANDGSEIWRKAFDGGIDDLDASSVRGTVFVAEGGTIYEVNDEGVTGYSYDRGGGGVRTLDVDDTGDTLTYYITDGDTAQRYDTEQPSSGVSSSVSGVVYDHDNNEINNSQVVALNESGNEVANVSTGKFGQYEMFLGNGTYNLTASKDGYFDDQATVTVSGDAVTQDFELVNRSEALHIKTRRFIEHGQSVPYEVTAELTQPSGDTNRFDVTTEATVTSGNTSVFSINTFNQELVGTSDTSINQRTYVQANWTDPDTGNTYTTRQNVTVANETVDNLDILPAMNKFTASIGGGTDDNPNDKTFLVIIIATALGAAVSIIATSLAGLGAMTSIMMMAWILGVTNDGIAIVTVFAAMFIGMNVAGNVDYQVRRG